MTRPVNILLVDDEPRNLDVLESILGESGYRLVRAQTPNEALLALVETEFAAIILDIRLPEMNGIELANFIKQRKRNQNIPIIFLTAYFQDDRDILQGYEVGAVDYMTKPVNPTILRSKVAVFADHYRSSQALADVNRAMEQEIARRQQSEEALRQMNAELESRVEERMVDLVNVNQHLQVHAGRAELLANIAAQLLKTDSPRTLLPDIFARVAHELGAEIFLNYLVPESPRLLLECCRGFTPVQQAALTELALGQGLCGLSAQRREPLVLYQLQDISLPQAEMFQALSVRSYACHPLQITEQLLGTLAFASTSRNRFTGGELQFMRTVCDLVSASLDRARLLNQVREARDIAEHANKSKDDFLAALSHELRTPLNPVLLLSSEAAANAALPAEVRADFALIRKNVEMEARLIDDLLDLTRITRGKLQLQLQSVHLSGTLRDAVSTVAGDAAEKRIELQLVPSTDDPLIVADPVRLQQVFWNILKNAVKFTPPEGRILVQTHCLPALEILAVEITDTGTGLTTQEMDRAFAPFSQGDHVSGPSPQFTGFGLGLSISRELAELHSGSIHAFSAGRGQGATFVVVLPLQQPGRATNAPAHAPSSSPLPDPPKPIPKLRRMLLVEDDVASKTALARLLSRRLYEVQTASSLSEARALAEANVFDVLISDIGLPDGTGYQLLTELKARFPELKAIAISGYGMEHDLQSSESAGFAMHLIKPIRVQALEAALAALAPDAVE